MDPGKSRYGGREDEIDVVARLSAAVDDEEAQLLNDEDNGQFELHEASRPVQSAQALREQAEDRPRPRTAGARARRRRPRWLAFLYGPDPPKIHSITPIFPSVQELPARWFERLLPRPWQRRTLLVLYLAVWAVALAVPLILSKGTATDASGAVIRHVDCVDVLWKRNNECGLDGVDCRPFSNSSFAFRCPADCAGVRVLNPHHVGPLDVNFRPLVVGGGSGTPYRGDSFICGAAIHAGVIDDTAGGCGVVTLVGEYYRYYASSQHGIDSIPFDSHFPLSFTVAADPAIKCTAPDPRWAVSLPLSLFFTALLSLVTTSPSLLFFAAFIGIFTHVALVSDPPNISTLSSSTLLPTLISEYTERLLPAVAIAILIYHVAACRALRGLPAAANLEKTLLWLGPFWLGALTNRTLEPLIPITRFTPHDLATAARQQPGSTVAVVVLATLVLLTALVQARTLYSEGRLPRYLALYAALLSALAGLSVILPRLGLHVHVHHYLLALLLLPGTAAQTRLSLAAQGLLLGLFTNGAARLGLAAVLETADALRGGDGAYGSVLPAVVAPLVERIGPGSKKEAMRIWFKWRGLAETVAGVNGNTGNGSTGGAGAGRPLEGISVLVNDVERFRGWFAERPLEEQVFSWTRRAGGVVADEYFRFGFLTAGGEALDYTEAGTWFVNGTWSQGAGYY